MAIRRYLGSRDRLLVDYFDELLSAWSGNCADLSGKTRNTLYDRLATTLRDVRNRGIAWIGSGVRVPRAPIGIRSLHGCSTRPGSRSKFSPARTQIGQRNSARRPGFAWPESPGSRCDGWAVEPHRCRQLRRRDRKSMTCRCARLRSCCSKRRGQPPRPSGRHRLLPAPSVTTASHTAMRESKDDFDPGAILRRLFQLPIDKIRAVVQNQLAATRGRRQKARPSEFRAEPVDCPASSCHVLCYHAAKPCAHPLTALAAEVMRRELLLAKDEVGDLVVLSFGSEIDPELQELATEWNARQAYPFAVRLFGAAALQNAAVQPETIRVFLASPPSPSRRMAALPFRDPALLHDPRRGACTARSRSYGAQLPTRFADDLGAPLPGTAFDRVWAWLDGDKQGLVVVGDFGDGETVFAYNLARQLCEASWGARGRICVPLRFALRDLPVAGSPRELLSRRLGRPRRPHRRLAASGERLPDSCHPRWLRRDVYGLVSRERAAKHKAPAELLSVVLVLENPVDVPWQGFWAARRPSTSFRPHQQPRDRPPPPLRTVGSPGISIRDRSAGRDATEEGGPTPQAPRPDRPGDSSRCTTR